LFRPRTIDSRHVLLRLCGTFCASTVSRLRQCFDRGREVGIGRTRSIAYRIVVPRRPRRRSVMRRRVAELPDANTGARLPIVSDREPLTEAEILIGDNAHLHQAGISIDIPALARKVSSEDRRQTPAIAGSPNGCLYASTACWKTIAAAAGFPPM